MHYTDVALWSLINSKGSWMVAISLVPENLVRKDGKLVALTTTAPLGRSKKTSGDVKLRGPADENLDNTNPAMVTGEAGGNKT